MQLLPVKNGAVLGSSPSRGVPFPRDDFGENERDLRPNAVDPFSFRREAISPENRITRPLASLMLGGDDASREEGRSDGGGTARGHPTKPAHPLRPRRGR